MAASIVSGMTQQFYHTAPSDLDIIKTSPTRKAIFQYLSQVSYDDFPEFVFDILTKIEGHKPVDITDGPGDEKQDILTITPSGQRCLTQCKHKDKLDGKYSGDELDRIVAACLRKNCSTAFFVTNGDLSPQAKNYVNDKEYLRGWPDIHNPLIIDYWHGYRLWEKIKNNQDILNKWFSGMAQSHGLRTFKFDVSFLKMPFQTAAAATDFQAIISHMLANNIVDTTDKLTEFVAIMKDDIKIKLKKWYQFAGSLDINLNIPERESQFWHQPLYAFNIEITIPEKINKYTPSLIKEDVIGYLFGQLPSLSSSPTEWWHILASQAKSFIYLHDISEPRQLELDSTHPFILVNNKLFTEYEYCNLASPDFKVKPNAEEERAIWIHNSDGIECIQLFEQSLNPAETFNYQQIQLGQLETLANYQFRAARNIDNSQAMRIRRILPQNWIGMTENEDVFIWCFPPESRDDQVKFIEKKLEVLGIKVLQIRDEDIPRILKNMAKDIPPVQLITITELSDAATPINLLQRGFWVYKELLLSKPVDLEMAMKLLNFKFGYENEQGFDYLRGASTLKSHSSELPNMLFDLFTVRCNKMVDIAILDNPITVNWRYFPNSIDTSYNLAKQAIAEFNNLYNEIKNLLEKESRDAPNQTPQE
jgi:hypothetical protein